MKCIDMDQELDALLPKNRSAPEITGYGFSKPASDEFEGLGDDKQSQSSTTRTSINTFVVLFSIIITLSLVVALGPSHGLPSRKHFRRDANATIAARVDRILSHTPLIGQCLAFLFLLIGYLYRPTTKFN